MSRTVIVPAQITTIEDKIVGSLGMTQLVLLGTALVETSVVFFMVAPTNALSLPKIMLMVIPSIFLCFCAFRWKGELILKWGIVWLTYALRPRRWIYNKNSSYLRPVAVPKKIAAPSKEKMEDEVVYAPLKELAAPAQARVERIMQASADIRYVNTKKGLQIVYSTEPQTE